MSSPLLKFIKALGVRDGPSTPSIRRTCEVLSRSLCEERLTLFINKDQREVAIVLKPAKERRRRRRVRKGADELAPAAMT